ncbi:MAG: ATP-binding protein [Nitrosomonas sp.]|uniref:ATP-binding protein n=1 Tax=Nitrosomonas sp. TaxID=42353 RepID=UPI0025DFB92E|nr:ATP-binding protein [Nitrosomonas sp.]MBY0473682.1 ATP-binding protein [Nitrosomonas sp.]
MGFNTSQSSKKRHAPPKAAAMFEALRGLGYSTASALADIIDNSIAAKAKVVRLKFYWNGSSSRISILDDGTGMSDETLDKAMRLGEFNPLDERSSDDLGRFGMGLKTASFSQARRLTVATKKAGFKNESYLRWDLDILQESEGDGWYLLEGAQEDSLPFLADLNDQKSGTIVLWENLDRIVSTSFSQKDFLSLIDRVENHLSMVFHRYLEGLKPKLTITINDIKISPWDPFLLGHPAKPWHSPPASAPSFPKVICECHVLPHKDRILEKEYIEAQGPDGWTAQQGFYVYRNERLLLAGSWLSLGVGRSWTKDEAHRLARIRLDIPNSVDQDWKIDIRKSTARPPIALRPWLTQMAEATRARARRAFAHRGRAPRTNEGTEVIQAWRADHFTGGMRYRVDLDHPSIRAVIDEAGPLLPQVKAMLRVLEETIPVQRIWIDTAENKETPSTGFDDSPPEDVVRILKIMYRNLVIKKGLSSELAKKRLLESEPFHKYPKLIESLIDPSQEAEL